MFGRKLEIRLPRRITAYFLLFALAALLWLGVGAVFIVQSVFESRSESTALRMIGRASDRVALAQLRNKAGDLQPLLAEIRTQCAAEYCAVVSPTGEYAAHSNRSLVGKPVAERGGTTDRWGEVVRVQYINESGMPIFEYGAPLISHGKVTGSLRIGLPQPSVWNYVRAGFHLAPLAFLGPICCMIAGAVLLNRMVRPVADIEQQLYQVATSPSLESCQLREVPNIGAAAIGWNRVVQQRFSNKSDSLQQRIRQSIEDGRHSRLDAVLNSVPDGVATTDGEGRLTYTNLPMSVMLGLKDVVNAGDGAAASQKMTELLIKRWQLSESDGLLADENRDRAIVSELTREENSQRRIARIARHPICLVGGGKHEAAHVWTLRDVTQQKLAEEMRDQFVDTATHELRTPLANIKAYAETLALADVIDVEQQKQFLNTINSEATRLARFVDDLLSVSSMELGSLALNKQVTDFARMLNEVVMKVRPQVEEKKQTFDVVFPEKLPEPELDKDKIAAVLVNLLGNAVKYTPEAGRVTFRVNVTDQQIELHIEDTGFGIAEDELPKVFDKFFRSQDHRVQQETGTGLGLALAQEVVRLHGGQIVVESELNKGSTFSVLLPRS
jgi:two-component system phosphate regulon sensor histidine kinase PhoR